MLPFWMCVNIWRRIEKLRDFLESELLKISDTFIVGTTENRHYNTTNLCFKGVDSDALIMALSNPAVDIPLIAVSNGVLVPPPALNHLMC